MMSNSYVIMGTLALSLILLSVFFHYVPFVLWLSAKVSGVRISLMQLFLISVILSSYVVFWNFARFASISQSI